VSYYDHVLYQITHRIRQSLDLKDILDTAVQEIQAFLKVDRVKVYRFDPDGSGLVIAESVDLTALPTLLHLHFPAEDIPPQARSRFIAARQRVIIDIQAQTKSTDDAPQSELWVSLEQCHSEVDPCHVEYLRAMGVTSSLVMPILYRQQLWGLLAIHHSQVRRYNQQELTTLRLLADQLEIAIAQARLLSQARFQARQEAVINRVSHLLHCPLNLADIRQRVLETTVMALSGDGGQLYLACDPLTGHDEVFSVGVQPDLDLAPVADWHRALEKLPVPPQNHTPPEDFFAPIGLSTASEEGRQHPLWQQLSPPRVYTLGHLRQDPALLEAFERSPIRTLLVMGLRFQGEYLGYIVVFRNGYDEEILWAGHRDHADKRNRVPKLSFDTWREQRHNQTPTWSSEDLRLMQAISTHVYMATLQQQLSAKLKYQAYHDSLTKLANRMLFTEQLSLNVVQANDSAYLMAVGFLDLDRFKAINDTLGHDAGDELLTVVAMRLRQVLRPWDTVARWGGDEFTLLLNQATHVQEVKDLADHILAALARPIRLGGRDLVVTGSLGIALYPYDGETAETLLKNADTALNQAKARGKNTFQLYRKTQPGQDLDTLVLETDLRQALERQELTLCFQPQVHIATGKLVGFEALARWHHHHLGPIPPDRFIALAEETGMIRVLGHWALRQACQQYADWQRAGLPSLRMAVNLSALQLRDPELVMLVQQTLYKYHMAPDNLELEITETVAMQDVELTLRILKKFQSWGVHIALDDFGMGYSSLNTIKHFPVQTLKIDKSFVQDAPNEASDAAIAKTIVALGKGLGLAVLAEGVETTAQLDFLADIGCDYAQGYLIGRPMTGEACTEWIKTYARQVEGHLFLNLRQVA
jgi:diguanylate cyclase (GGDEF)-like protein